MKDKLIVQTIASFTFSFILILIGIFNNQTEKIFYFSAGIMLFLIADYFLAKIIFNKKFKELNSKKRKKGEY